MKTKVDTACKECVHTEICEYTPVKNCKDFCTEQDYIKIRKNTPYPENPPYNLCDSCFHKIVCKLYTIQNKCYN